MDLWSFLRVLNRWKGLILMVAVLTAAGAIAGRALYPPGARAECVLRVVPSPGGAYGSGSQAAVERLMNTYARVAASERRLAAVRERLGTGGEGRVEIEVEAAAETELLIIRTRAEDPGRALAAADELARLLLEENPVRGARLELVDPAYLAEASPLEQATVQATLALASGIAAGIGAAFITDQLDTRLHTTSQAAAAAGIKVVGEIPEWRRGRDPAGEAGTQEAFERACLRLRAWAAEGAHQVVLVTSPGPGEGKSTVAANLALGMERIGWRAAVVDAAWFYAGGNPHLGPRQQGEEAGSEGAGAGACLEQLREKFELVLIDAPAFLSTARAAALAPLADGVLVVVRLGRTRAEALRLTCEELGGLKAKPIGLVANGSRERRAGQSGGDR